MVKICQIMLALVLLPISSAIATTLLTLDRAIQVALDNNSDLKAKEAAIDATRGTNRKLSAFLPSSTRIGVQGASDLPFANEGEYKLEANISQELEIAGQIFVRKKIGSLEVQKAEKEHEWFKNLLVFQVKTEFYQLLYLEKKKQVAEDLAESNRTLAQFAKKREQQRVLTEFDSDLWHFEDADSFSSLMAITAQFNEARLRLKKLLGDETVDIEHIEGNWPIEFAMPAVDDVLAYALSNRADIGRIRADIKQKASSHDLARRSWVPNPELSLFFDQERSVFNRDTLNSFSKSDSFLGLGISIPLNLFVGKSGDVAKAAAEKRIAAFEKTSLETEITRDVKNYWQQFELASEIVARYNPSENKLQTNVKMLQGAYQKGNIDLATYLNYRDRLIKGQFRYAEALWTRTQAWTALTFVSGRILGAAK